MSSLWCVLGPGEAQGERWLGISWCWCAVAVKSTRAGAAGKDAWLGFGDGASGDDGGGGGNALSSISPKGTTLALNLLLAKLGSAGQLSS